jgi:hypothetical protein
MSDARYDRQEEPDFAAGAGPRHRVACLFETRAAAERAADDVVAGGIPRSAIDVVDQGAGTTETGGGGLWESIKRLFTGEEGAASYYEGVNRGHTLLTVQAGSEADAEKVTMIVARHDPIDLDQHESNWREAGWTGAGHRADVTSADPVAGDAATLGTPDSAGYAAANAANPPARTGATSESAMAGRAGPDTLGVD